MPTEDSFISRVIFTFSLPSLSPTPYLITTGIGPSIPSATISDFVLPSWITVPELSLPPSSKPVEEKASKTASSIIACTSTVIVLDEEVAV